MHALPDMHSNKLTNSSDMVLQLWHTDMYTGLQSQELFN